MEQRRANESRRERVSDDRPDALRYRSPIEAEVWSDIHTHAAEFVSDHPSRDIYAAEAPYDRIGGVATNRAAITHARACVKVTSIDVVRQALHSTPTIAAQGNAANAPKPAGYVRTDVAMRIIGFTKKLNAIGGIGVITGPAGCGKSLCADYLRSEIPGSILIRVTTAGASKVAVLDMLAQQLRLTGLQLASYYVQQQILQTLKPNGVSSGRLIIVDEAHKLIIKRKDEGLHTLRDLADETECPMLLLGTKNLHSYIHAGRSQYEALDQMSSRASAWLDLTEIVAQGAPAPDGPNGLRLHGVEDIKRIVTAQGLKLVKSEADSSGDAIGLTPDALLFLAKAANATCGGCLRTVKWILLFVRDQFGPGDVVTADDMERLQAARIGQRTYVAQKTVEHVQEQQQRRVAG